MTTYAVANNITRFSQTLTYANSITDGMFGLTLLIVVFIISFIAMRQANTSFQSTNAHIFAASMFVTNFFCAMFYLIGIVNSMIMYSCIVLLALSILSNVLSGN